MLALKHAIWTSMDRQQLSMDSYNELARIDNDLAWIDNELAWVDKELAMPKMIAK